jgi:hypothetical protein
VPDHRVIENALQSADDVLQHRRPGNVPDRRSEGTFRDAAIESLGGT